MGREILDFNPQQLAKQELRAIRDQNKELRNSNHLMGTELRNSMSGLFSAAASQFNITSMNPLFQSNIAAPISQNFTFLNYFYKTHGVIQTAINQPVLDALRGGLDLHSDVMDEDDIQELLNFIDEEDILYGVVGNAENWARLFGGGAIIINDGGKFEEELMPDAPIRALKLYAASRWELGSPYKLGDNKDVVTTDTPWQGKAARESEFYMYYGERLHKSRVITISGKEAPWMLRWQLQGWGMSEVERMIEDFNLYIRTRNVLYDLLNEAKVDVFMVEGFRDLMLSAGGDQKMLRRIQTVQQAKNMNNALILDKMDAYDQKQLTFTGIAEVMKENKMAIASALRMPISKIFGISATGFGSGEDDIENYNAMVESEVRQHLRKPIRKVLSLIQRFLWGQDFDYQMKFKPLRVMSAKDEEEIREKKFNRVIQLYDRGLMDSQEVGEALHKDTLVSVDTKAQKGELEEFPEGPAGTQASLDQETNKSKSNKEPKEE